MIHPFFLLDILLNILINIPAKPLLRFKSVSKPWNVMISDNQFKKTHRDQSKALGHEKLLLQRFNSNVFEFRNLERSQLNPKAYKNYALWNPSTRDQYRTLTCPHNHLNYNNLPRRVSGCGLCYDSSVDDYKVILIYDLYYVIYSLNNNSWTRKTGFPCPVQRLPPRHIVSSGISLEGCVFWSLNMGKVRVFVNRASTIIYFDVKSDEMKSLPTPDFVGGNDLFYLTSLKDCLSLYGGNMHSVVLDIWIMQQDESWKLLMSISNLPSICKKFVQDRVLLGCTRNGEIVFQGWQCCSIFMYNPQQQLFTKTKMSVDLPIASICLDSLYSSCLNLKHKRKRRSANNIKEGSI
ncbi:hypothetical protein H5410_048943 [Solanum commersonii]|uniref:F-box domain-containing protein n=1 Tax=Solanum commersonii TaxID=4109 RepID=A0A9J5XL00_SOLCO|nr:hypothetical protein H5410_048943 [Solanum commersonii]